MRERLPNLGILMALISAFALVRPSAAQPPGNGPGFALMDQPSAANYAIGRWLKWVYPPFPTNPVAPNPLPPPGGTRYGTQGPFTLKYAVDSQFMANQSAETRANAKAAVVAAFQTWSDATNGYMRFAEAAWPAVVNLDATFHAYYAGPPVQFWCDNYCPGCTPCSAIWPGWGADIDVFSRPTGFTLTSNGFTYQMTSGILGFAALHRSSDGIWSTEIYLNENFTWTANPTLARTPAGGAAYLCGASSATEPVVSAQNSEKINTGAHGAETGAVYDIQTVVLHELGHALGFDHPNESCSRGGIVLDPYTRMPLACSNVSNQGVMHGAYSGVRRTLTDPDIGGLAFLYRPRKLGDVDADDALTISDGVYAMSLFENPSVATPYEVSTLDFINQDGRIGLEEMSLLLFWLLDPVNYTPGLVTNEEFVKNDRAASTISITGTPTPPDIGLRSNFSVTLNMSNPNQVAISGWDIMMSYDSGIFSNPQIVNGTLLPAGSWSSTGTNPGQVRFAKLGFPPGDQSSSGTLGTINFTVNLPVAALSPPTVTFTLLQTTIAAVNPANQSVRVYGSGAGDMLVTTNPTAMSYQYDVNLDNKVDLEDVYTQFVVPVDVNKNSVIDAQDNDLVGGGVRYWELPRIIMHKP